MRLTAKSEYGLLAMIDLASSATGAPVSAREISERQSIPLKFLEQLLVQLRKVGLISSLRGAHGGFSLARDATQITVLDVVETLEGPLATTVCDGERASVCGRSDSCAAAHVWNDATAALRDVFATRTLAELVAAQKLLDTGAK